MLRQSNLKYFLAAAVVLTIAIGTCSILYAQSRVATQQQQYYQQPQPQAHYQQPQPQAHYQQPPPQAQQQSQQSPSFFSKLLSPFRGKDDKKEVPVPPANVPPPTGYTGGPVVGAPQTGQQVSPPRVAPPRPGQLSSTSQPVRTAQSSNIVAQPRSVENRTPNYSMTHESSSASQSSSGGDGSIYDKLTRYRNKEINSPNTLTPPEVGEESMSSLPTPPNMIAADRETERTENSNRRASRSGSLKETPSTLQKLDTDDVDILESENSIANLDSDRRTKPRGLPVLEPPIYSEDLQPSSRRELQAPSTLRETASRRTPPTPKNTEEPNRIARREMNNIQQASVTSSQAMEIHSRGPKNVFVGQEATYEFAITNNSGAVADEVVVSIEIPTWVEIVQPTDQSLGMTSWNAINSEVNMFKWNIGRLNAKQQATLTLHIIPREPRPINLVPRYDFRQTSSEVAIEVQQPRIEMILEGPNEALWGVEEKFPLRIRNTGNGDAQNVKLVFMATGSEPQEVTIDELLVGDEHMMHIDMAPRISGDLQIHVQASGPYGLSAETRKHVTIHRAEIETIVEGPPFQFVGNTMEYVVIAKNRGTAPAQNVEITVPIPSGIKYVSHSDNGHFLESQNELVWHVHSIPAGQEYSCSLICEAKREGEFQLNAKVIADTGIQAMGNLACLVEAIADVTFKIEPPGNPWEVGKEGEYTVTITNRGTKSAQGIKLTAYFTEGLTAQHVSGTSAQVSGSTVLFDPIAVLSPGQSIPCKIRTIAATDGNHKIHVTMECQSTNTNKSAEETTYYFQRRGLRKSSSAQTAPIGSTQDYDFAAPPSLPTGTSAPLQPNRTVAAPTLPPVGNAAPLPGATGNVMLPPSATHQIPAMQTTPLPVATPALPQTTSMTSQNPGSGMSVADPVKTRLPQSSGSGLPLPPPVN